MRTPLTKAKIEYTPGTSIYLLGIGVVCALVLTGLSAGDWSLFLVLLVAIQLGGISAGAAIYLSGTIVSDSRPQLDQKPITPSSGDFVSRIVNKDE
jgi:hypothetical protein